MVKQAIIIPVLTAGLQAQTLPIDAAIRQAWDRQPGLQAGEAMVASAKSQAAAARSLMLPTLQAGAQWMRTDEPMMAFGTRLNEARVTPMDFDPARLNHPDPIQGLGAGITLNQPLYAGGRIRGAQAATEAQARSAVALQAHRRQQVAVAVVQAYFGAEVAQQAVAWAEDALKQARETERFIQARVEQGLMLKSELARIQAFRAQAEAGVLEAKQREASARSALALLTDGSGQEALSTPLEAAVPVPSPTSDPALRQDLEAAKQDLEAARSGVRIAEGSRLPEVGVQLGWGTLRPSFGTSGGDWTSASLGAKWTFSFGDGQRVQAARAASRAAELNLRWQENQAKREQGEADRAVETADARIRAARESVAAAESARDLRVARHREGLLPLTEVLDAETGLAGARTLLLDALLQARVARAQQALAAGLPVEGVK